MHISEGILSPPVLISGAALSAAAIAVGLRKLDDEAIPRAAVLTAAFFVASLIHVPIGISSAHLILNGLLGIMLGWAAFPAILVALILQAIIFNFGGLTVLGVNTFILAAPAVLCRVLFVPALRRSRTRMGFACIGGLAGGLAVTISGVLGALAIAVSGRGLAPVAGAILVVHAPIIVTEALITAGIVSFLSRVKPEMLRSAK